MPASACPSESSVTLLARGSLPPRGVLSEFAARSKFLARRSIARIGFGDPTMPLAIPSAAWSSFAGLPRPQLSNRCALSSSFAFLQSIAQRYLARRPQPTGTSHGLLLPTAHIRFGGPPYASVPSPLRSAFRVWLPSGRLSPAEPQPVLFHTSRAHGIHPSELPPPGRYPPRFRGRSTHLPFHPSVLPPPKRRAGPTGRGFWVSTLPRVPGSRRGLTRQLLAAPLGFALLGPSGDSLAGDFAPTPPTRFPPTGRNPRAAAPRSIARLPLGPVRRSGQDNPSRVSAPVRPQTLERFAARAIVSPHAAAYITAARPTILGLRTSLYRSCPGVALGAGHQRPQRRNHNVAQHLRIVKLIRS